MADTKRTLEELEDSLNKEIGKILNKGDMSPAELENATKAVCLVEKIKDIQRIDEEYGNEMDHSEARMPRMRISNTRGRMSMRMDDRSNNMYHHMPEYEWNDGRSTGIWHQDHEEMYPMNSYGHDYDRDSYTYRHDGNSFARNRRGQYSRHSIKDRMIDRLERMFDEAKTEHERRVVQEWIDRIESGE